MTRLPRWSTRAWQPSGMATVVVGASTTAGPDISCPAPRAAEWEIWGGCPRAEGAQEHLTGGPGGRRPAARGRSGQGGPDRQLADGAQPVGDDLQPGVGE